MDLIHIEGESSETGQPRTDMAAGAGLEIVSLVGKAIADSSMKDDPAYYDRLLARMVGQRQVTSAVAPQLLPALARAWKQPFAADQVKLLSAPQSLDEAAGRYSGADPGTDVVMTFTVHELLLSEKPSSRGLKAVFTAGMYDKEVMPYFSAHMGVYRRQEGGELKRIWTGRCMNNFMDAPAEEWTVLRETPERGGQLIERTLPRLVQACELMLRQAFPDA